MQTFRIYASEVVTFFAEVEANNAVEAKSKFKNGDHNCVEHFSNDDLKILAVISQSKGE
jgi:hypothetical protein